MEVHAYSKARSSASVSGIFMGHVYRWMTIGLGVTALTAYAVAGSPRLVMAIMSNYAIMIALIVVQIGLVIALGAAIHKFSAGVATGIFLLYALLNGLTLSSIFIVYPIGNIANAFLTCTGMFLAMSVYGTVTKRDLTGMGSFMFMGLIGIIIASIVNIFLASSMLSFVISCVGVIVFTGLTAYDTQKLRQFGEAAPQVFAPRHVLGRRFSGQGQRLGFGAGRKGQRHLMIEFNQIFLHAHTVLMPDDLQQARLPEIGSQTAFRFEQDKGAARRRGVKGRGQVHAEGDIQTAVRRPAVQAAARPVQHMSGQLTAAAFQHFHDAAFRAAPAHLTSPRGQQHPHHIRVPGFPGLQRMDEDIRPRHLSARVKRRDKAARSAAQGHVAPANFPQAVGP